MELYKSEHDLLVLHARMGHSSIAATNIYAKASDKEDAVKESWNWRKRKREKKKIGAKKSGNFSLALFSFRTLTHLGVYRADS